MTRLQAISRFSPGNCDPGFLESITVGREELLRALEKAVSSSVRSGAGHHWLIVGPRGAGKTHLVALLRDRVQRNETLRKRVVIAYLKEEERGVAHFLDWLVRILQSFVRHEEAGPELARDIEQLMDMDYEAAQAAAEQLLIRSVGNRRLLLLVENLGEIFSSKKGMGREGQQRFRDLVQQHPFWTIVATTQALFDDVQTRDAPFYGFFKIQHVQPLTFEEAASLLERLAQVEQRPKLRAFLKTAPARGRIRAVHSLTRGSPRLLVIFYQFIDSDSVEDLSRSFLGLVDSLTSYYQERMNALSAGQQKIVEALCSQRAPVTVKQIARLCFVTPSTASSELKRLADLRYVTSHRAGRESYYEISEPLFRICFEVKENRGYPVRLFVDFLGTFYTAEELERKYRSAFLLSTLYRRQGLGKEERSERERLLYIAQAALVHHETDLMQSAGVEEEESDPNLLSGLLREFLVHADHREIARLTDAALAMKMENVEFVRYSARAHRNLGELEVARKRVEELLRVAPNDADTWVERAMLELESGDRIAAEAGYRRALELNPEHVGASMNLAVLLMSKVRIRPEISFLQAALLMSKRGQHFFARASSKNEDEVARSVAGMIWENSQHLEEASSLLTRASVRTPRALVMLSNVQMQLGHWGPALQSARQACAAAPHDAQNWRVRATAAVQHGETSEALQSLAHVTALEPSDATAWVSQIMLYQQVGDIHAALASARQVTLRAPENPGGWLFRGQMAVELALFDEARECFQKAAEPLEMRALVYATTALTYFEHERYAEGLAVLEGIIALGVHEEDDVTANALAAAAWILLRQCPVEIVARFVAGHRGALASSGRVRPLVLGLGQALTAALQSCDTIGLERLQALATSFIPELSRHEEFSVMSRLFATGVRYLGEKDERILLELPLEERNVLREMLTPPADAAPSESR
jgi:tetratricopeptide (TPR) repeat protein